MLMQITGQVNFFNLAMHNQIIPNLNESLPKELRDVRFAWTNTLYRCLTVVCSLFCHSSHCAAQDLLGNEVQLAVTVSLCDSAMA